MRGECKARFKKPQRAQRTRHFKPAIRLIAASNEKLVQTGDGGVRSRARTNAHGRAGDECTACFFIINT
jgi:hypothetical protein